MKTKITVFGVLGEGFIVGMKNFFSLLAATVLYILTIWIPYINIGTTIAMCSIPVALAKGKVISPLFIFESKYRKFMGEFFLLIGFMFVALLPLTLLGIIPGIVTNLAWSIAIYLLLDKGFAPGEALVQSNKLTYGYKWKIFGISFLLCLILYIFMALLTLPFISNIEITSFMMDDISSIEIFPWWAVLLLVIISLLIQVWMYGCEAIIYRNLSVEEAPNQENIAE